MNNGNEFAKAAQELVGKIPEEKNKQEESVRLEMTPAKIPYYAKLFPCEMVKNSVGTFFMKMIFEFYGWDGEGDPELIERAEAGDKQAERILVGMGVLADMIAHDLKGMQYDLDNDEDGES